jgi:hypothetical protein
MAKVTGKTLFRNLRTRADISVDTVADRDALLTYRRRWGMVVAVFDDGDDTGLYELRKNHSSNILADNENWVSLGSDTKITTITIPFDGQTVFTVPENISISYAVLNGITYKADVDYTISGTTLTWADNELETDDELLLYYQL